MTNLQTIKSSRDFQLAKKGLFVRSQSFLIQAYRSEEKLIRVGYTVSKQNGNAIIRNKIKRRLRSLAREILSVKGKLNWNYVIIGKKNALNEDFINLKQEFQIALKNIHRKI
tara:strand:- start:1140 stop:1475 length:336 start_codon:yes stop_codon:yes gene_type:complete